MALANGRLNRPHFRRPEDARKGRVLAESAIFFPIRIQDAADVLKRPILEKALPLAVATDQSRRVSVLA
jgi:hypothetical protein